MYNSSSQKTRLYHYPFETERPIIFQQHRHKLIPEPIHDIHLPLEVGVVLSGRMHRYNGNVKSTLERGGLWLAGVLEPHGRQAEIDGTEVAVFIISSEFFFNTALPGADHQLWLAPFNTAPEARPVLHDEEFARLAERLSQIMQREPREERATLQIQLTLLEIMLHANRLGNYPAGGRTTIHDYARLRPAVELIYRSPKPVNTSQAAALCELSTSRFSLLFRRVTGLSFSKFSLRYRLSRVADQLARDDLTLDELADAWGFSDKSHLAHRFKEYYSVTPATFRERSRT